MTLFWEIRRGENKHPRSRCVAQSMEAPAGGAQPVALPPSRCPHPSPSVALFVLALAAARVANGLAELRIAAIRLRSSWCRRAGAWGAIKVVGGEKQCSLLDCSLGHSLGFGRRPTSCAESSPAGAGPLANTATLARGLSAAPQVASGRLSQESAPTSIRSTPPAGGLNSAPPKRPTSLALAHGGSTGGTVQAEPLGPKSDTCRNPSSQLLHVTCLRSERGRGRGWGRKWAPEAGRFNGQLIESTTTSTADMRADS